MKLECKLFVYSQWFVQGDYAWTLNKRNTCKIFQNQQKKKIEKSAEIDWTFSHLSFKVLTT